MKFTLVGFLLSALMVSACYAQSIDTKKLDSLFDMLQNHELATGSVAVSVNGKIIYQRAIGFTAIDGTTQVRADVNTKYRIGSVSKMFTATIVFQLIDEGKLRLSTRLASYFPQLANADKITIGEMLCHRSGLHDYTKDTGFPDWMDKPKTREEMLKIVASKDPDFEPGFRADYCNTNYLLLSYIIENICTMSYAQAIEQRIASKIGLKNTHYAKLIDSQKNEAFSYKYANGVWNKEKETYPGIHNGAGALVSTAADLTRFIHSLFAGKLIKQKSLQKMETIADGYGMGIFPYDVGTAKGYGHNGRIEEFYSAIRYYPEKKLAVSYITNGILYPRTDILDGLLKICFNTGYTIPFSKQEVLHKEDLKKYIGTYASGSLPFKVTCKEKEQQLIFEVGGNELEAASITNTYFMNRKTGSFFEFNTEKQELLIKETDNVYTLQKEK